MSISYARRADDNDDDDDGHADDVYSHCLHKW